MIVFTIDAQELRRHDLEAYDSLPPEIRKVLREVDVHLKAEQAAYLLEHYDPCLIAPEFRDNPSIMRLIAAIEQVRAQRRT